MTEGIAINATREAFWVVALVIFFRERSKRAVNPETTSELNNAQYILSEVNRHIGLLLLSLSRGSVLFDSSDTEKCEDKEQNEADAILRSAVMRFALSATEIAYASGEINFFPP